LEWLISQQNNNINGYSNHIWNGVSCLTLAEIIKDIIEKNLFWEGVRHIYSPSSVSKYDLCAFINEIYNLNLTIEKVNDKSNIDRSLKSNYSMNFNIKNMENQIIDLFNYYKL